MNKTQFTGLIKLRGWSVKDALSYWGRSQDWYHRNAHGTEKQKIRLECMANGLSRR